tara:strand:- start:2368 stop:2943 length:576 start_codon:yes stop_codon:yes gene_type:complete
MFNIFYIDKKPLQQNKNYYKNILVKIKDKKTIYSIGCILLQLDNQLKIIYRFYKIHAFTNGISLEYINHILTNHFPKEISYIILKSYLKNDVSFISIKNNNNPNTFKIISNLTYSEEENKYKTNIINKQNTILHKEVFNISSNISKNLEVFINNNKKKNLDNIFYLNNPNIEYSNIYKIYSSDIAWGINIL